MARFRVFDSLAILVEFLSLKIAETKTIYAIMLGKPAVRG
jgi:hypothetical protein